MKYMVAAILLAACFACNAQKKLDGGDAALAFPGAEGFGKYSTGGRGGKVMIVTNLDDSGPGSLREAVEAKVPRIVVFAVSGTIHLAAKLNIQKNVTIAGQSAPGGGICVADYPVALLGDNIIIRYMRFRMGDRYQNSGMVDGAGGDDALGGTRRTNIVIDHCSVSWSTDEVLSVYAGDSTTLQWNIMSEPLNYSYHFEAGDKDFEKHGYGGIMGGKHISIHHNLFAHCTSRTPRFDGIRNCPEENVDFRNNVIYNWGTNNTYAGEGGTYNIVNNYYKYGPDTHNGSRQIANPWDKQPKIQFGKWYVAGNYMDGSEKVNADNWAGIAAGEKKDGDIMKVKMNAPLSVVEIPAESAETAYKNILKYGGAILPERDTLDVRILKNVAERTGRIIDVQGGFKHGTPYDISKIAWPVLLQKPAPADTDKDGIPDVWEKAHQLNLLDASDAVKYTLHKHYSNIEMYLNSLVK